MSIRGESRREPFSGRYVEAPPGTRVLVTMPDGYRVWPDAYYDQFHDAATFFGMSVDGIGEHGERVTVRGNFIARVQPARVMPVEARRPRRGLMRFTRP